MRFRLPGTWELNLLANAGYWVVGAISRTVHVAVENGGLMEERLSNGLGQVLVTWHGRSLVPLFHFRDRGFYAIISPSRDGEITYRMYRRFGWEAARGSSARGAAKAALACVRKIREGGTLAIVPDGPTGPAGVVQPGILYFARKSGCPVIPAGVSAHPAWFFDSWDRFLLPKPFARASIVFGDPVMVPDDADDETMRRLALELGETINTLQRRADEIVAVRHREKTPVL